MPMTSPALLARAPPELPGCREASVCMTSPSNLLPGPAEAIKLRPRALTTPALTDPSKPSGLPIATTSWPTRRRLASPSVAGW